MYFDRRIQLINKSWNSSVKLIEENWLFLRFSNECFFSIWKSKMDKLRFWSQKYLLVSGAILYICLLYFVQIYSLFSRNGSLTLVFPINVSVCHKSQNERSTCEYLLYNKSESLLQSSSTLCVKKQLSSESVNKTLSWSSSFTT